MFWETPFSQAGLNAALTPLATPASYSPGGERISPVLLDHGRVAEAGKVLFWASHPRMRYNPTRAWIFTAAAVRMSVFRKCRFPCLHGNAKVAFSKTSTLEPVFKKFRFQARKRRCRVNGQPKRNKTFAFSLENVVV